MDHWTLAHFSTIVEYLETIHSILESLEEAHLHISMDGGHLAMVHSNGTMDLDISLDQRAYKNADLAMGHSTVQNLIIMKEYCQSMMELIQPI